MMTKSPTLHNFINATPSPLSSLPELLVCARELVHDALTET
jgi:hypothetical protein